MTTGEGVCNTFWGIPNSFLSVRQGVKSKAFDYPEYPAKKLCAAAFWNMKIMSDQGTVDSVCKGPSTPRPTESGKLMPVPSSTLESLPLRILEIICEKLVVAELCRLSQVSKYLNHALSKDEFWVWRAMLERIAKASQEKNWKWNVITAKTRKLHARILTDSPFLLKGDFVIIDPFKIFGDHSIPLLELIRPILCTQRKCVVTYRGISAVFVISTFWDRDTAFEVTRKGTSLGIDEAGSGVVACIPKRLVEILAEESASTRGLGPGVACATRGGVWVEGVDGEYRSSGDGDFVILEANSREPARWTSEELLERADIICAAGGSFTFTDDSSDEDEAFEATDEEIARALREDYDDEDLR